MDITPISEEGARPVAPMEPARLVTAKQSPSFPTGRGQSETHAKTVHDAELDKEKPNPSPEAGKPYRTITFSDIEKMVRDPQRVDKHLAHWFIPSTYSGFDARSHAVQREKGTFKWLTLDVDKNDLSRDDIEHAVTEVIGHDVGAMIYATRSSRPGNRKWRALIPVKDDIPGADYFDTASAFYECLIEASQGILLPDMALARPGQLVFLPNRGEHYDKSIIRGHALSLTPDHPIVRKREAVREDARRVEKAAAEARERKAAMRKSWVEQNPGADVSPIEVFNQAHSVEQLLEKYGYARLGGSQHWRSPMQTTSTFATRVFDEVWVSLSSSDAAAGLGVQTKSGHCCGDAFALFCHFEHDGDVSKAVKAYAQEAGLSRPRNTRGDGKTQPRSLATAQEGAAPAVSASTGLNYRHTSLDLIRDDKGRPVWNMANAMLIIQNHQDWSGVIGFNKFTLRRMLLKPIPGSKDASKFPRNLEDDDYSSAQSWFNWNGFPKADAGIVRAAIRACSRAQAFDPLCDFLEGLKWDGVSRIDTWLTRYLGVADCPTARAYGRCWLISAVARAYRPGAKVDHMLVLEGDQGLRKSSAMAALAGADWFSDGLPAMNTKDSSSYLRGRWILEVAELEAMRRDMETVKAFITRQIEVYRPAYASEEVDEPRRCVFVGTTNKDNWLTDSTGGRRFWPVRVTRVDLDAIVADREMLWAEAVAAFKNGEQWWLDQELSNAARVDQEDRMQIDPWRAEFNAYLEGRNEISIKELLRACLGMLPQDQNRGHSNRASECLQAEGWHRNGRFTSGEFKGQARYTR